MKKLLPIFVLIFVCSTASFAQTKYVTVITTESNLRGTPDNRGLIVTTVNRGEVFELIKTKGVWYLIQTPEYVGWIHGNNIKIGQAITVAENNSVVVRKPKPVQRAIRPPDDGSSPFSSEYVGANYPPTVVVNNNTTKILNLEFGGVKYKIPPKESKSIEIDAGTYEYTATATGVRPLYGIDEVKQGYRYTWTFVVITRRVR